MRLIDVYRFADSATYLYALLAEREPCQSISHQRMPTVDEHLAFVRSVPYSRWYLVEIEPDTIVGAVYVTKHDEIGIAIFKEHRKKGYARAAIDFIRARHEGRLLANINPANEPSIQLFTGLGAQLIQATYQL